MASRRAGNTLDGWEVAIVKAMIADGRWANNQDILAFFSRPTRSINHRLISEIRSGKRHSAVDSATSDDLTEFLSTWPDIDPQTGLSTRGDELLIKAREAMIAAVHTFNGAGLTFRTELFIVTAVIAWTYLLHAWFKRERIDYRYREGGVVKLTAQGAEMYWDLAFCLRQTKCPLSKALVQNLEFLLEIRHEIEHRSTNRIDDALSAELQACCINFNEAIKSLFGAQFGLERRLPIALQFATFGADQRVLLKRAVAVPPHVAATIDAFKGHMTPEEQADPAFSYRVLFRPVAAAKASKADEVHEFVRAEDVQGLDPSKVYLKHVDRKRYAPSQVVKTMQAEGFPRFRTQDHTDLWRALKAKDPAAGFGVRGVYVWSWEWFDTWVTRVRQHCQENVDRFA